MLNVMEAELPAVVGVLEPLFPEVLVVLEPTVPVTTDVIGDALPVVCWPPQPDKMSNTATHPAMMDKSRGAFAGVIGLACEINGAKTLGAFMIAFYLL